MKSQDIIKLLPYTQPFLFVDEIEIVDENGISGHYTFREDEYFYKGHFQNNPVTPGVILIECMAQIGLVSLGIYLMRKQLSTQQNPQVAFTSSEVDFFIPVFPGEKVKVVSKKTVFRFGKLKCDVELFNETNELVCRGKLSGMLKTNQN